MPTSPNPIILAPSILAGNHANLLESLSLIHNAHLPWVHLDIMDGHFVPNLSFGPQTVSDLRKHSSLYFDVHLMLSRPDQFIDPFLKAGANNITIHTEPSNLYPVLDTLLYIRSKNSHCGIAINPNTPADHLLPFLPHVDLVLLMTVQPGFGGQPFRHDVLPKIQQVASWRSSLNLNFRIQVDGGIDPSTAPLCSSLGTDTLVAGSSFFKGSFTSFS